jgi:hypothetical protein
MFKYLSCDENMCGLRKGPLFSMGEARFFLEGGSQSVFQRNQKIYS